MTTRLDVAVELFYDGAWHDLVRNDDVFTTPIVIKRGQSDELRSCGPRRSACSWPTTTTCTAPAIR